MTDDIPGRRLRNQHLIGPPFDTAEAVVQWLGAVQAQDYHGAKWAVARRTKNSTSDLIDELFNAGKILRTHVLRPTWHFVMPEDIGWTLELTAPRVKALMAYYDRKLELTDSLYDKTNRIITEALQGNNYLTRTELGQILGEHGVPAKGQRLGHIVMRVELDGLICSGPLRGKQFTYALLAERAPQAKRLDRKSALTELARRYFTSHGPATVQDFAWWSGLTVAEAKQAAEMARLHRSVVNDKAYWSGPEQTAIKAQLTVQLLPNYDEYLISYKDYSPIFDGEVKALAKPFGNALLAHIVVRNGRVIGGWRRIIEKNRVIIKPELLVPLNKTEQTALQLEAAKYEKFIGLPVSLDKHK